MVYRLMDSMYLNSFCSFVSLQTICGAGQMDRTRPRVSHTGPGARASGVRGESPQLEDISDVHNINTKFDMQ